MTLGPPTHRSLPAPEGRPRCPESILAPGPVGSALRCRLGEGHDEVRYAGDPVHEAEGVAGLLIRWRYLDALVDVPAGRALGRYPQVLEVASADSPPLHSYTATSYRPRQHVPPGEPPPPQLRLAV